MKHEFVEVLPENLSDGVIYVSVNYAIVAHRCCCGCGNEVITPLSPTDWKLTFDGESVTLYPSIGNWNFDCKSHYWIRNNEIIWADQWSEEKIELGRMRDQRGKKYHYQNKQKEINTETDIEEVVQNSPNNSWSFWTWVKRWL